MEDIPKQNKVSLVERRLTEVKNSLYDLAIQTRVAERVGDKAVKDQAMEQMKRFEKMKDEYDKILAELDKE